MTSLWNQYEVRVVTVTYLWRHWYGSLTESVCHAPSNFQWHYKLKFIQQKPQIFSDKKMLTSHLIPCCTGIETLAYPRLYIPTLEVGDLFMNKMDPRSTEDLIIWERIWKNTFPVYEFQVWALLIISGENGIHCLSCSSHIKWDDTTSITILTRNYKLVCLVPWQNVFSVTSLTNQYAMLRKIFNDITNWNSFNRNLGMVEWCEGAR